MFNVDRWGIYTRQNYSRPYKGNRVMTHWFLMTQVGNWSSLTSKQGRRMRKKFRSGDKSIGMYM